MGRPINGKRKHPTYDDQFRASAVCMLQSQGYPEVKGALAIVARHLKVPDRTLSRWFNGEQNPPPDQIVNNKRIDFRTEIRRELGEIVTALRTTRQDANYRELGTVFGILFDKLSLLEGLPTERQSIEVSITQVPARIGKPAPSLVGGNGNGHGDGKEDA